MNVQEANKRFVDFLVTNNFALSLGEEPSFRTFVSSIQPLYKPLDATAVNDWVMKTFERLRPKIIAKLQDHKLAFSTDVWTSPNKLDFLGITASMLTDKFTPMDITIAFKNLRGDLSGDCMANSFYDAVKDYKLNEKVFAYYHVNMHQY